MEISTPKTNQQEQIVFLRTNGLVAKQTIKMLSQQVLTDFPHRDIESFNTALKVTLENINENVLSIILGDININLIEEQDPFVKAYLNNYFESNYIPCISLPTQITHHSATLIDHIFVKIPKKLIQNKCSSGKLIADIADHLPNFTFIDIKTRCIKERPYIRLFTQDKINQFNACISNEPPLISPD